MKNVELEVLTCSRRRCCICYYLEGFKELCDGQIAHVDRDNTNASFDNLVFLCLPHHNQYDSLPRQTKRISQEELKFYRRMLYIELGTHPIKWEFRIKGHLEDISEEKINEIVAMLESISPDASIVFRKAVRGSIVLKLESSEAAFELIKSLFENGVLQERLGIAVEAVVKEPGIDPDTMHDLGEELSDNARFPDAIECFNLVLESEPRNAMAWSVKASALVGRARITEDIDSAKVWLEYAIRCAKIALDLDSSHAAVVANYAVVRFECGEKERALEDIDRAINLDNKLTFAWFNKGAMLYRLGRFKEAIDALEAAERLGSADAVFALQEARLNRWKPR
jgi:tetratricopeptide (TPR) repeat protein